MKTTSGLSWICFACSMEMRGTSLAAASSIIPLNATMVGGHIQKLMMAIHLSNRMGTGLRC
jgi:hypothetical protein